MNKIQPNPDTPYQQLYQNQPYTPIFIQGIQRSGTSILYTILNQTHTFNIVTAYHLINYPNLIHLHETHQETHVKQQLTHYLNQQDRGIDRLQITPDFPEEYGFILKQTSPTQHLTTQNYPTFQTLCQKIQYLSKNQKPLLLKNPFDFSNFLNIKKMQPNAKFIFIHRNPLKTLNSQLNATRTLLEQKSPYMAMLSPEYEKLFEKKLLLAYYRFLHSNKTSHRIRSALENLRNHTIKIIQDITTLSQDDYFSITYEQLCENPKDTIYQIMVFLGLRIEQIPKYDTLIKPRKTKWLPEIKKHKHTIIDTLEPYLTFCGYEKASLLEEIE